MEHTEVLEINDAVDVSEAIEPPKAIGLVKTEQITHAEEHPPLRELVKRSLNSYFSHLDGQKVCNLYTLVMAEVEAPLLGAVLNYTKNGSGSKANQSKAAELLGLSRGTLRKKLQEHDLL